MAERTRRLLLSRCVTLSALGGNGGVPQLRVLTAEDRRCLADRMREAPPDAKVGEVILRALAEVEAVECIVRAAR
jgi:hypothetical protein